MKTELIPHIVLFAYTLFIAVMVILALYKIINWHKSMVREEIRKNVIKDKSVIDIVNLTNEFIDAIFYMLVFALSIIALVFFILMLIELKR